MLDDASRVEAAGKMSRNIAKNLEIFRTFVSSAERDAGRRCHFHFFRNPTRILGRTRVESVRFAKTTLAGEPFNQVAKDTEDVEDFSCGLVFRSIGSRGTPIKGLPFDASRGVLRHCDGRLVHESGKLLYGLYATGWIKRGANGTIGTNRADSLATVGTLFSDLPHLDQRAKPGASGLAAMLVTRSKTYVTYQDWQRIDHIEVCRGEARGKPREKLTRVEDMFAACKAG